MQLLLLPAGTAGHKRRYLHQVRSSGAEAAQEKSDRAAEREAEKAATATLKREQAEAEKASSASMRR
eukprot:6112382-Prymnesium_polylepis.1